MDEAIRRCVALLPPGDKTDRLMALSWFHVDRVPKKLIDKDAHLHMPLSSFVLVLPHPALEGAVVAEVTDIGIGTIAQLVGIPNPPELDINVIEIMVKNAITAINLTGASAHIPTPNIKNASRVKRGKKPLYDWRTVEIKPRPAPSESRGGTHASPRAHDRRGHYRSRGDRRWWVRATKVGNPANGQVFHDYVVRA